jgi:hypothetical protein
MMQRATMMSNTTHVFANSRGVFEGTGLGRVGAVCKQILNVATGMANHSAERLRYAALSVRELDDIGLTVAERDRQLGWMIADYLSPDSAVRLSL